MIRCLMHPFTYSVVAELIPQKEVNILDQKMLEKLTITGITVSVGFKNLHRVGWRVYLNDNKEVFTKAFEQFYFVHGLQQQAYFWEDKSEMDVPTEKLAQSILSHYYASLKSPSDSGSLSNIP
ncbi:hypothetical protein [Neochlamydia sp. AcF95]|uniref:hypothetical protein n=1 Tax=Neochlamydia sp. AcF95 TaxID=2795734 RepID=UPI001BCA193E|nr:hypothetical protein [Neochlamydia sp. AcF95]MBS4171221.1 Uncharacterized protein [Neochlamydia sp. AcF95]